MVAARRFVPRFLRTLRQGHGGINDLVSIQSVRAGAARHVCCPEPVLERRRQGMNGYGNTQVMFSGAVPEESYSALESAPSGAEGANPDLCLYRERTIALLKRYLRISIEVGRLPSILGRELFRSKVTSYRMSSFEDGVIFVHDVEQALDQLQLFPRQII